VKKGVPGEALKAAVREMPPWFTEKNVGIQKFTGRRLGDVWAEIDNPSAVLSLREAVPPAGDVPRFVDAALRFPSPGDVWNMRGISFPPTPALGVSGQYPASPTP
jgi:hypothetical protein